MTHYLIIQKRGRAETERIIFGGPFFCLHLTTCATAAYRQLWNITGIYYLKKKKKKQEKEKGDKWELLDPISDPLGVGEKLDQFLSPEYLYLGRNTAHFRDPF